MKKLSVIAVVAGVLALSGAASAQSWHRHEHRAGGFYGYHRHFAPVVYSHHYRHYYAPAYEPVYYGHRYYHRAYEPRGFVGLGYHHRGVGIGIGIGF